MSHYPIIGGLGGKSPEGTVRFYQGFSEVFPVTAVSWGRGSPPMNTDGGRDPCLPVFILVPKDTLEDRRSRSVSVIFWVT
jgi:hypothetical protein